MLTYTIYYTKYVSIVTGIHILILFEVKKAYFQHILSV